MVLYPTSFTVVLTVVDVPLYFFFLNGEEKSRRISLGKNMKIQDIAVKTGYSSPRSFIRAFRNGLGVSPTDYRDTKK